MYEEKQEGFFLERGKKIYREERGENLREGKYIRRGSRGKN